jgi:hypothetical protein
MVKVSVPFTGAISFAATFPPNKIVFEDAKPLPEIVAVEPTAPCEGEIDVMLTVLGAVLVETVEVLVGGFAGIIE